MGKSSDILPHFLMKNKAFIVVDLGFGDAGKGTIVDFLTRRFNSNLTIRFSGGSQCGHNVIDEKGNHHLFAQFGAGSLAGARTLLGKNVLINPLNLLQEEKYLSKLIKNPFENLYIDENCVVITPYYRMVNRFLEMSRGNNKHGSCGHGVWEALKFSMENPARTLYLSDLSNIDFTRHKLIHIRYEMAKLLLNLNIIDDLINNQLYNIDLDGLVKKYEDFYYCSGIKKLATYDVNKLIKNSINPIFEGNQGILLDGENEELYPYVTANSTTSRNALKLLKDSNWTDEKEVIGVTRTYMTRHGEGPFNEIKGLKEILLDERNPYNEWQGDMRFGLLDFVVLRYAIMYDGHIDSLALTHIDEINKIYQPEKFPNIEKELGIKIKIKSFGPKSNEKEWCENEIT